MNNKLFVVWIVYYLAEGIVSLSPSTTEKFNSNGSKIVSCLPISKSPEDLFWIAPDGTKIRELPNQNVFSVQDVEELYLIIQTPDKEHEGVYTCNEIDKKGKHSKSYFNLTINAEERDNIGSINVLEVTENSALFHIGINNPTTLALDILVKYQERFDRNETLVLWKYGDNKEILNLTASGHYSFQFKVHPNGKWSAISKVVLLPSVPEMIVYLLTGGNLVLNFYQTSNDFNRGTIEKYLLTYHPIREVEFKGWVSTECEVAVEVPKCKFPRYEVAGLFKNTYYEVRVRAYTVSGYGKPYIQKLHIT